jgi:hypothetical protein
MAMSDPDHESNSHRVMETSQSPEDPNYRRWNSASSCSKPYPAEGKSTAGQRVMGHAVDLMSRPWKGLRRCTREIYV